MVDVFEIANNARKASDDFSATYVGRAINWLKCWEIEVAAAAACGLALRTAAAIGEPAYVVKEWQAAVDLHLAFASSARQRI